MALIFGIESSCDETAAAVVRDGATVLSNSVVSQHELHAKFGGVVPEIATRAHLQRILPVIEKARDDAAVPWSDVDAIAVGHRPGLIGSLLVGVSAAKALAWSLNKPLIGVDHVQAHLYACHLDDAPPSYPALGLVISGGHTSLYHMADPLNITRIGHTIDDAVGEAYDKVAAMLELGYPGGPIVEQAAQHGDPDAIDLPRTLLEPTSLNFSFSGLKTAVLYAAFGQPVGRGKDARFTRTAADLSDRDRVNICASFQRAVSDTLTTKLKRAADQLADKATPVQTLIVGGGVSINKALRTALADFAASHDLMLRLADPQYCLDNAAMIAGLAEPLYAAGRVDGYDLPAEATSRLDA